METQKTFFEIIKDKLPSNLHLADIISQTLNISINSAYRRIRGEKELTMNEMVKLCLHFEISMDSVLNYQSENITFKYTPLDGSSMENYYSYMEDLSKILDSLAKAKQKEMTFMALDIPLPHFTSPKYKELTLFKIYTWFNGVNNLQITYEKFVDSLDKERLFKYYDKIDKSYKLIPSTEIWTKNTIEPILHLLEYYYDLNYFEDRKILAVIVQQLHQLIEDIEKNAEKKYKDEANQIPFCIYISPLDLMNDFMVAKRDGANITSVKLYTINGLITSNQLFFNDVQKQAKNIISKSVSLSGTSERERFRFFRQQKNKVNSLLQKIETGIASLAESNDLNL